MTTNIHRKTHTSASTSPATSSTSSALPPSPFTTTTDIMNKLNTVMERYQDPVESEQDYESTSTTAPAFQLQRRLPNGVTRQASPDELKAADLETKLKQVAEHVAQLPNDQARLEFCEQHRTYGNTLYQQQHYEQAMDVYLTCLMAIPVGTSPSQPQSQKPPKRRGQQLVFLQILNNLAQTALQLQWYRKAQDFCRLALEEVLQCYRDDNHVHKDDSDNKDDDDLVVSPWLLLSSPDYQLQIAKLYFKRGKASRYKGEYTAAHTDLTWADTVLRQLQTIVQTKEEEKNRDPHHGSNNGDKHHDGSGVVSISAIEASLQSVRKELQILQAAAQEGRKNQQRHRQAMQQVFRADNRDNTAARQIISSHKGPSHEQFLSASSTNKRQQQRRSFSTLRAPPIQTSLNSIDDDKDAIAADSEQLSPLQLYWWYYMQMIGRIAQTLLEWIGEENDNIDNPNNRHGADEKKKKHV